jgi:hypothetical protein
MSSNDQDEEYLGSQVDFALIRHILDRPHAGPEN